MLFLFFVAFVCLNEFQIQTFVTKEMEIEVPPPRTLPQDPRLWEDDYNRITLVAIFFRAKIAYNSPEYGYCIVEAPVVLYRILMFMYRAIEYIVEEPIIGHISLAR